MVVIDASIAFKWFAREKEAFLPQALNILKAHLEKKEIIITPDIILYELSNAWITKTTLTTDKIKVFLKDLQNLAIIIEPLTYERAEKAAEFAKKYHVTVYDASYAVLALENKCSLITADAKFVKAVKLPFIKSLETK